MYCNYTGRTRSKCTKDALDSGFNTDDGLPDTCGPQRGKGMFCKLLFCKNYHDIDIYCNYTGRTGSDPAGNYGGWGWG